MEWILKCGQRFSVGGIDCISLDGTAAVWVQPSAFAISILVIEFLAPQLWTTEMFLKGEAEKEVMVWTGFSGDSLPSTTFPMVCSFCVVKARMAYPVRPSWHHDQCAWKWQNPVGHWPHRAAAESIKEEGSLRTLSGSHKANNKANFESIYRFRARRRMKFLMVMWPAGTMRRLHVTFQWTSPYCSITVCLPDPINSLSLFRTYFGHRKKTVIIRGERGERSCIQRMKMAFVKRN